MHRIDVLIVTHQGGSLLADCLRSVRSQTLAAHQIVVVVSSNAAIEEQDDTLLLRTSSPTDFAPAANMGFSHLGRHPVVLLNDDTVLEPNFLEELAAAYSGPGIYQPRILRPDGTIDNTGHLIFFDGFNVARDRGTTAERGAEPCGAFSGAAVMFSPEVLKQVGVFDSEFGAYGEDLDLSLRAVRQGFTIHHVPRASVMHHLGATYGRTSPRKVFLVERNRTRAAIRSLPWTAIISLPATSMFRLSVMGTAAIQGRGLGAGVGWRGAVAAVAGLAAGTMGAPNALFKRGRDRKHWSKGSTAMWKHLREQAPSLNALAGVDISPHALPPTTDQ
jgi:GT2 family glycosyltransferase